MSSATFKGGLSAGGPAFTDKAKLAMRRPTPDSDVLASSDDEHTPVVTRPAPANPYPAGRRPSSGWLQDIQPNRKFSLPSVSFAGSNPTTPSLESPQQTRPGTSGFSWNTASFTAVPGSATRLKEVVPSPTSANPDRPLPSPTNIESDEGINFLLNQQNPIRKSVRSQSYSVGQADLDNSAAFSTRLRSSLRHRPSKPSLLGDGIAQLAQLREDEFDEIESSNGSEQGIRLPLGYWEREQKSALLKQAAVQNARAPYRPSASPSGQRRKQTMPRSNTDFAIDELDHDDHHSDAPRSLTRRFSEHATGMVSGDPLGRRHSFATYPSNPPALQLSTLPGHDEVDEDLVSPHAQQQQQPGSPVNQEPFDPASYFAGYGPASRAINASAISAAHPAPIAPNPHTGPANTNPYAVPAVMGRPGRRLYVVVFKCSRAEIYYTYDNTGLEIRRGDLVIVEGDRGCDLGQVSHADVSMEDAKKYKAEASDEHYRWLVMFSQYSLAGTSNDSGMLGALARANGFPNNINRGALTNPGTAQDQTQELKPKMIKRLAQQHEIAALRDKEGQEAKAKRVGALKAAEHKFPMEILDAEYQADHNKLTYFYYAETYVNFNDLVVDLFKQYKVRIWMSAVNPASVVNPAGTSQIQPPSAIGPGAILHNRSPNSAAAVGPGFGSSANAFRQNNRQQGRNNQNANRGAYDEGGYYPFANQLQGYPSQSQYGINQWAATPQGPDMFGRYPGYPGNGGTPLNNFGGWYPPGTFSSSPAFNASAGNAAYRNGPPANGPGAGGAQPAYPPNPAASDSYNKAGNSGSTNDGGANGAQAFNYGNDFVYNNPYASTSTAGGAYDPAMVAAALQSMSFGNFNN
ncbi:hypothetical protein BU24DRAFT_456929 [Aaosphaeria arxii CBS 175.79]|uniref:PSP1 C-terminal domain-containing protein n=1 Tax=Aaosphaeria arxii CBS 175.79 TaxID=1450172 RepID=A0A6A5Y6Q9_9PLEO|nr:uncharacterized protein BU24DRAFT_456929 [Aaosphaeria arxii CBS 175.79]KAF2020903.1 hypothetical protein BU24DRAFT_456929 [Aaosphaeria arxii CBS 175.79]